MIPRPSSRAWLATAIAMIAFTILPTSAHAQFGLGLGFGPQIVYDPTAVGKLIAQLARQAEQIALAEQQLDAQITALRKLAAPPWRDIAAAMAEIDALAQEGEAIAYSLRNVDAVFRTTFAGTANVGDAPATEQVQAERTLATLRGVLNTAARAAAELPAGLARLSDVKRQMATVVGHEQALELNGAIGVYSAEQLTFQSQQLAALANAQAVYFADQVNDQAQVRANTRAFLTVLGEVPATRPGFSFLP